VYSSCSKFINFCFCFFRCFVVYIDLPLFAINNQMTFTKTSISDFSLSAEVILVKVSAKYNLMLLVDAT